MSTGQTCRDYSAKARHCLHCRLYCSRSLEDAQGPRLPPGLGQHTQSRERGDAGLSGFKDRGDGLKETPLPTSQGTEKNLLSDAQTSSKDTNYQFTTGHTFHSKDLAPPLWQAQFQSIDTCHEEKHWCLKDSQGAWKTWPCSHSHKSYWLPTGLCCHMASGTVQPHQYEL